MYLFNNLGYFGENITNIKVSLTCMYPLFFSRCQQCTPDTFILDWSSSISIVHDSKSKKIPLLNNIINKIISKCILNIKKSPIQPQ